MGCPRCQVVTESPCWPACTISEPPCCSGPRAPFQAQGLPALGSRWRVGRSTAGAAQRAGQGWARAGRRAGGQGNISSPCLRLCGHHTSQVIHGHLFADIILKRCVVLLPASEGAKAHLPADACHVIHPGKGRPGL